MIPTFNSLSDLIAYWDTSEGKPYKGSLIDKKAYESEPNNLGCMCAQGQVLHTLAGWSPDRLSDTEQDEADRATANLLNISTGHAILLRNVNDNVDGAPSIVLTDPDKVLGDQWSKLLDFWWHLDQMTPEQWAAARDAARDAAGVARVVARFDARYAARDAARDAAGVAAGDAARVAARDAAGVAAGDAAGVAAGDAAGDAARASSEIQGARILRENGKGFYFLPMFGFADPDAIPARAADYGQTLTPLRS